MSSASSVVRPIAALDVGGSSVKRGIVELPATVTTLPPYPVDATGLRDPLLAQLAAATAETVAATPDVEDLAIAFPDPFDYEAGIPLIAGQDKFDSIHGVALPPVLLERAPGITRLSFCHDAEAAAVGEATAGAAAGVGRVMMVTLGTGFGAAVVDDGGIVDEHDGIAPRRLYREHVDGRGRADDVLSARGLAARIGVDMAELRTAVADRPSDATRVTVERFGRDLERFLATWAARLEVDVVVVGGGLAGSFAAIATDMVEAAAPRIIPAILGSSAALIGAAHLHQSRRAS